MTSAPEHSIEELTVKYRRYRRLTIVFGALSAFLLVVLIGQLALGTPGGPVTKPQETPAPTASSAAEETPEPGGEISAIVRRDPDDTMAMGDVDAPVVLVEWTDFRCPFCAAFTMRTMPDIIKEYVDTGKVRIEVRDVAFFGDESIDAAVAARAAGRQDKYFEYLHTLYEAAPQKGHPDMPREKLIGFARDAGVADLERFAEDLTDPELRQAVAQSTTEAQQWGVTSVPFFVAGDKALSGAQPIATFRQYLDNALGDAR